MNFKKYIPVLLILLTCIASSLVTAQTNKNDSLKTKELSDTLKRIIAVNLNEVLVDLLKKQNEEKKLKNLRDEHIAKIYAKLDEVKNYFSKGIDTVRYRSIIELTEKGYNINSDVTANDNVNIQTPRNMVTSLLLNKELLKELEKTDKEINLKITEISNLRKSLDTLSTDTILFKFPSDSTQAGEYFGVLIKLSKDYDPVDSMALSLQNKLEDIHNTLSKTGADLNESIRLIESKRSFDELSFFKGALTQKNSKPVWDNTGSYLSTYESFKYSSRKSLRLFLIYTINNISYLLIFVLLTGIVYFVARKLKSKIKQTEHVHNNFSQSLYVKKPFVLSLFILLSIFQLVLPRPPFIVSGMILLFQGALLLVLLLSSGKKYAFTWLWITALYFFAYNGNLFLTVTLFERWIHLLLALASAASVIILKRKEKEFVQRNKWFNALLNVSFAVFLLSAAANIFGYVNLSNLIYNTFISVIFISVLFYAVYSYIKELLLILILFSKESSSDKFEKSMESFKYSIPAILKYVLIAGGIIIISRNFYIYDYFADGLSILLNAERSIGDFKFKLESVFLFIIIIAVSLITSRAISFYSELNTTNLLTDNKDRKGIGNWLLLVRIAVFTAGVLIAFASSGIPMDRLTIILGSLGVGIGLGLQSLIGNLVSGVFLAFEKPVKIGDQVEVDNNSGIIKEIGIRSSKIETFDGSDVIIPNVDLLTKHVINWTRKNNQRRAELSLCVKGSDDVNKCREIILQVLNEDKNIEKLPEPMALLNNYSSSSVEFKILFWTDINSFLNMKSEVYYNIRERFKTEGIDLE